MHALAIIINSYNVMDEIGPVCIVRTTIELRERGRREREEKKPRRRVRMQVST